MIQAEVKMSCRMIPPVAEMPEECLGSWAGRSCIAASRSWSHTISSSVLRIGMLKNHESRIFGFSGFKLVAQYWTLTNKIMPGDRHGRAMWKIPSEWQWCVWMLRYGHMKMPSRFRLILSLVATRYDAVTKCWGAFVKNSLFGQRKTISTILTKLSWKRVQRAMKKLKIFHFPTPLKLKMCL